MNLNELFKQWMEEGIVKQYGENWREHPEFKDKPFDQVFGRMVVARNLTSEQEKKSEPEADV